LIEAPSGLEMDLKPGDKFGDRYQLLSKLGSWGPERFAHTQCGQTEFINITFG
jgi:hypothetical protein